MSVFLPRLRRFVFGISREETTFARRGFRARDAGARERLERSARFFVDGYHAALAQDDPDLLARRLHDFHHQFRGFAFEGAAMGLALLDRVLPWGRSRWRRFVEGPGEPHVYMVHVGVGWAVARLPWARRRLDRDLSRLDPLLRWLVVDGYGFHEGFFHWRQTVQDQVVPRALVGYARRAFDQGLGRSLWFSSGADVARLPTVVEAFPPSRRADLWSGVGLACTYAGGVEQTALQELKTRAAGHWIELAQGAAFAAKARQRAGNLGAHTELACRVLCGMSADEAAGVTDDALVDLPSGTPEPAYEIWRQQIQDRLSRRAAGFVPRSGFVL